MSVDMKPITGTAQAEPTQVVDLDPRAEVRLIDTDDEFGIAFSDGGVEVVVALPRGPEAWLLLKGLVMRTEALVAEVRLRGVSQYLHGPHTGPGASR